MKARLFLKGEGREVSLLAKTELEVCPRGIYVVDGIQYQCTGQPIFYLDKSDTDIHVLSGVDLVVEKVFPDV